jgi:preprotein translocase subunit YajC
MLEFLQASWPLLVAVPVFYLFIIRPQIKKQKNQSQFEESLEKGQEIVTSSGIIGRINKIEDTAVHIQVDNKTFLKVTRPSISREMTEQYREAEEKQKK